MVNLTIKIMGVESGVDWQNNPAWYVTYKVVEWPDLGPWTTVIPKTYTKPQAQAKISGEVTCLATQTHEYYGISWVVAIP